MGALGRESALYGVEAVEELGAVLLAESLRYGEGGMLFGLLLRVAGAVAGLDVVDEHLADEYGV